MDGYTYRVGSHTNILGRPPVFYDSRYLKEAGCSFASVYAVTGHDAIAIADNAQTAAGYRGVVWSSKLWVDFDGYRALEDAIVTLKALKLEYVLYATGNRGGHIGITRHAEPSHTLPMQDKAWVKANLPGADLGLYWHLHLIRLPGAVHEKTGAIKRLIETVPGNPLVLPAWEPEAAAEPSILEYSNGAREGLFKHYDIMSRLTYDGGSARKQLVMLATALREAKASAEEALWVVQEANRGFPEPKEDSDIERIVGWAYGQE